MKYNKTEAIGILERTPVVLQHLLQGVSADWINSNEGPDSFSPYDVIGHLLHGEQTDWVVRAKIILEHGTATPFEPWDRFAQYEISKGKTIGRLLDEFAAARTDNVQWLQRTELTEADLDKTGTHPVLGTVSLRNLLSTWVVHDLTHIAQVTRVMAKQYREEIGPWSDFFRILNF